MDAAKENVMRRPFISRTVQVAKVAVVMGCFALASMSGAVIAKAYESMPQGTCLPDEGHEDGPECWHLVYIHGEPGDPTYESYWSSFGLNHGCTHLNVTDDSANPVDPYIFSTELCLLTTADYENMFEAIANEMIGTTPATVVEIPFAAR